MPQRAPLEQQVKFSFLLSVPAFLSSIPPLGVEGKPFKTSSSFIIPGCFQFLSVFFFPQTLVFTRPLGIVDFYLTVSFVMDYLINFANTISNIYKNSNNKLLTLYSNIYTLGSFEDTLCLSSENL